MSEPPDTRTSIVNVPYILKVIDAINNSTHFESYTIVVTSFLSTRDEDAVSLLNKEIFHGEIKSHLLFHNRHYHGKYDFPISRILNKNSITIVFAENNEDDILNRVPAFLRNYKLPVFMVVLTKFLPTDEAIMSTVSQTMGVLSKANIINSIVIYDTDVFKFHLFPKLKVFNMTGKEGSMNFKAQKIINLHGYHIRTPIKEDMPRVFKVPHLKKIRGMSGIYLYILFGF